MMCHLQVGVLEEPMVCVTSWEQGVADVDPSLGLKAWVVGVSAKGRRRSHSRQTGGRDDRLLLLHSLFPDLGSWDATLEYVWL